VTVREWGELDGSLFEENSGLDWVTNNTTGMATAEADANVEGLRKHKGWPKRVKVEDGR